MKAKFYLIPIVSLITIASAYSQDATATVTEEELIKYATAMDSINEMSANVKIIITDMVKNGKVMTATRYNEISKIITDETKLTEAKATPEEIAFVKEVTAKRDEESARINQAFQSLAKDYVGAATFNKVKKALATDTELKSKYDSLMEEMAKDNPGIQ
jgi:Ca2+-binding EF-hand superfamily protein